MIKLTKAQIEEIAEELDCGQRVFVHKTMGKIIPLLPEEEINSFMDTFDDEMIAEIEDIQENPNDYQKFEKMYSGKAFQVMEEFTETIDNVRFKNKLIDALNGRKPFRNFKEEIDDSDYREEWFAFKKKWYMEWVEEQCD